MNRRLGAITKEVALVALLTVGTPVLGMAEMATGSDEYNRAAVIDELYPLIDQAPEPPGRSVPDSRVPGSWTWSGQRGWRTLHGPVTVWWSSGKPFKAEAALYPDGSRGEVRHVLDIGWQRRAVDRRGSVAGTVDVLSNEVIFTDGEQRVYVPPPQADARNLEADLARDAAFLAAIRDDRFANAVYSVFSNREFYKGTDERGWLCGDRQAAGLVKDLRGLGESYQDWFPHGGLTGTYPDDRSSREAWLRGQLEQLSRPLQFPGAPASMPEPQRSEFLRHVETQRPEFERLLPEMNERRLKALESTKEALAKLDDNADVFQAVYGHLTRLGWRTESEQDRERSRQRRIRQAVGILQEIKELEKRPEARPGEWAEPLARPRTGVAGPLRTVARNEWEGMSEDEREVASGGLHRRLLGLARTGRIAKDEYDSLRTRIDEKR